MNAITPTQGVEVRGPSRVRQLVASGVAAATMVASACTPEQVQASMEYCQTQPDYKQCLGDLALLGSNNTGLSTEAYQIVTHMNDTLQPGDDALQRLRNCESTDRYHITNKSGKYMGAYQFDQRTWNGAAQGNDLDELVNVKPHHAAPEAQDALARAVYEDRGPSPWPKCGKRI